MSDRVELGGAKGAGLNPLVSFQNPPLSRTRRLSTLPETTSSRLPGLPAHRPPPRRLALTVASTCSQVYWRHAAGDLDRYVVLIRYNLTVLQNQSVSTGHNECVFSSLTPGRLYTVTVETWSGGYVSSISTDGRTCESGPVA